MPTRPKIWVAELSCSIWKVPSESAKPPVWKVGTVSSVILLRLAKKVVRTTQLTFLALHRLHGERGLDALVPERAGRAEDLVRLAAHGGSVCSSRRSVMFLW